MQGQGMANIRGFEFPDALHYLVEHDTWARRDADGNVTVGITSLGAHISGDFIDFMAKPVGASIERERALGMLEMSKVIRSARSPINGLLVEANNIVKTQPRLINSDPYGAGWLVRLQPIAWDGDRQLLVTGAALPAAVEAYMALLSRTFGETAP
jgi:glycine cleavage system H protein